jgi:hypothetical protein
MSILQICVLENRFSKCFWRDRFGHYAQQFNFPTLNGKSLEALLYRPAGTHTVGANTAPTLRLGKLGRSVLRPYG